MNLLSYLNSKGVQAEDIVLYSIGTDGLKVRNNMMYSISFADLLSDDCETMYIYGGRPWDIIDYTGISKEEYLEKAEGLSSIANQLEDIEGKFRITYNTSFSEPFLLKLLEDNSFLDIPKMDVVTYSILKKQKESIPESLDISEVDNRLKGYSKFRRTSFRYLCSEFGVETLSKNTSEDNIRKLKEVIEFLI